MSVQDRAKQFIPFAALKGLPEALAAKEKRNEEENSHHFSARSSSISRKCMD